MEESFRDLLLRVFPGAKPLSEEDVIAICKQSSTWRRAWEEKHGVKFPYPISPDRPHEPDRMIVIADGAPLTEAASKV